MAYYSRRDTLSSIIFAIVLIGACTAMCFKEHEGNPSDESWTVGVLFSVGLLVVAVMRLGSSMGIDDVGLHRRDWFGLRKRVHTWESLTSWRLDRVPEGEDSAGTEFVAFEFAAPPWFVWFDEYDVGVGQWHLFVTDIRIHVEAKEQFRVGDAATPSPCSAS